MSGQLSDFERRAGARARHRALIMQILCGFPNGLTTQQIMRLEQERYGYTFLTDNRLRELRALGWVKSAKSSDGLLRWIPEKVI